MVNPIFIIHHMENRMSKLELDKKYIFECVGKVIYAREFGSDPSSRFVYIEDCESKCQK